MSGTCTSASPTSCRGKPSRRSHGLTGAARTGTLRSGGSGEAIACSHCPPVHSYFRVSARIDIWLRCQSKRIAANSSTLFEPIPAPPERDKRDQRSAWSGQLRGLCASQRLGRLRRAWRLIASTFDANAAGSMIGVPRQGDIDSRSVSLDTTISAPTSAARSRIRLSSWSGHSLTVRGTSVTTPPPLCSAAATSAARYYGCR